MSMKCAAWRDSTEVVNDFSRIIPEFHSNEQLTSWVQEYTRVHAGRLRWDADFLIKNYKFSSCLNIGGAPFIFEYLIKKARPDIRLVSLDLDPTRFPGAERALNIKMVKMNIESPDPAAMRMLGQFECVVFCEIFEHLRMNLLETMSSVKDLVAEGGILYLTTPNGLGLYSTLESLRGHTGSDPVKEWSKLTQFGHMGHVREYSRNEVRHVLQHCGFVVETQLYRRSHHWTTLRSKMRNTAKALVTTALPWFGDELVFVLRKAH